MSGPGDLARRYAASRHHEEDHSMTEFVFLYRGGTRASSPQEGQTIMQQWMTWMQELAKTGNLKDRGQPLDWAGKVVKGKERTIVDGPFAEAKDLVGGYTLVLADDLAHAAELSKGCPIFDRGGAVEVRPVMKM
jgi:hypothetical protein